MPLSDLIRSDLDPGGPEMPAKKPAAAAKAVLPVRGEVCVVLELAQALGLDRSGVRRGLVKAGVPITFAIHPATGQRVMVVPAAAAQAYVDDRRARTLAPLS
jgi:hypothetical protein